MYKGPEKEIAKEEIEEVIAEYSSDKIVSVEDISAMFCPNRIVLAFKKDGDLINLKGMRMQEKDLVSYEVDIIRLLNAEGVGVQQLMQTMSGNLFVNKDDTTYLAYKKLEGDQIKDIDQQACHEFGAHMSRLHKALEKYRGHGVMPRVDETFRYKDDLLEHIGSFPLRDEYERLFQEFKGKVDIAQLEKQVIHGGVSTAHSFFIGKKFNAFIDWDYAHVGYRAYDVALFMADMLMPQPKLFARFLKAYTQENPLNEEEKKAIYYFIRYRLLMNIKKYHFYDRTEDEQIKGRDIAQEMIKAHGLINEMGIDRFMSLINRDIMQHEKIMVTDADLERMGFKGVLHTRRSS